MVGSLTCTRRIGFCIFDVTLYAVILCTADGDGTTLHEEELPTVDAVAHGGGDVDGGILDSEVFARLNTVFHVTHHIECSLLGKLGVAFDIKTTFLRAAGSIDERIGGSRDRFHLDALAVLDVYGCATKNRRRIGQCQSIKLYRCLIRTRHIELAVGRSATQRIGNLFSQIVALGY